MSITRTKMRVLMLLAAATAVGAGLYMGLALRPGIAPQTAVHAATLYPQNFPALPSFQLIDHTGLPFDNSRLTGHWTLLFFGYTHCPDVCPMTLHLLQTAAAELSGTAAGENLQVVFVSIDGQRDTPARLQEYVQYFNPAFIGVSGTDDQLQILTAGLGAFYSRAQNPDNSDSYLMDHSAGLFLLDPRLIFGAAGCGPYNRGLSDHLPLRALNHEILISVRRLHAVTVIRNCAGHRHPVV
jgi:protein SCO1/2